MINDTIIDHMRRCGVKIKNMLTFFVITLRPFGSGNAVSVGKATRLDTGRSSLFPSLQL